MTRLIPLAAAALAALAAPAAAQSPGALLPTGQAQGVTPSPDLAPPDAPPAPGPLAPDGRGAGPAFTLRGVAVEGATAIPPDELAPLWAGLIGAPATLATLDRIAAAVAAEYRARGYVLSQAIVPPQTIGNGVARIQVIEGFVDRVAFEGGTPGQRQATEILFAPVPADRPMRLQTLERSVLLSRDILGGVVDTVMAPSATTFAAADLTVQIAPAPVTGFGSIDNRGSRLYGAWSFVTGVTAYDKMGLNEELGVLGAGSVDGSLGFVQATFSAPIFALSGTILDGSTLDLEIDYANGDPDLTQSGAPDEQTLTTNETNFRIALRTPVIRTRAQNLFVTVGFDWQDSENVTGFGPDESTATDRLLVLKAEAEYDRADRFGGVTLISGGLRQGLDTSNSFVGGGVSSGVPDFTLGQLNVARLQRLGSSPWAVWLEGIGQYAANVLPNSERFALGDATIGRGYAPGNTTGDSGYGARLELRRQLGPEALGKIGEAAELYAYGDYGRAYDRDGDRDGSEWQTLASAGFGVRLDVRPWLTITPEIARQLEGAPTDTTDPDLETRFYIGAVARF